MTLERDVAARTDSCGTLHTCNVRGGLSLRAYGYGYAGVMQRVFACGCRPVIHRFRCKSCLRWVGWCYGADDDMPQACDDCWSQAHRILDARAVRASTVRRRRVRRWVEDSRARRRRT